MSELADLADFRLDQPAGAELVARLDAAHREGIQAYAFANAR